MLVRDGLAGVTHRAVAEAAGVSLAATTRHFATKLDMIAEVSGRVMSEYLAGLERLCDRVAAGEARDVKSIEDVLTRAVLNGLLRDREKNIAWCELILHGGRSPEGRDLARRWYDEIDRVWRLISGALGGGVVVADAVDIAVGLQVLLHPLRLDRDGAEAVIGGEKSIFHMLDGRLRAHEEEMPGGSGRARVLAAAINVLVREGPQALSYRAVSEEAGLSRSAPGYYFDTVDDMLDAAQAALFRRAKDRYRLAFQGGDRSAFGIEELADLTSAIFFSEALVYADENLAFYSVWVRAAERENMRPAILSALQDQQRAWDAVLRRVDCPSRNALRMQALFVGKLIRVIATGPDVAEMAGARAQFIAAAQRN